MGDPAGVGPEVCLRLLGIESVLRQCSPIVFGDAAVLRRVQETLGDSLELPDYEIIARDDWRAAHREISAPTVLDFQAIDAAQLQPGRVNADNGNASYRYIEAAIDAALAGEVQAVATGPINKEALWEAGIRYPGHTEIFAEKTDAGRSCMMQICDELTCSFVTTHVGYREVPELLSQERILEVIELSREALLRIRGREPKFVVCGLNPHAGEHGLFGDREEERWIIPAMEAARAQGMHLEGPLPPDTAFLPARRKETDCFICMYHDQGHIPLKALAFDVAVNTTLGLPIIRTSVDHGTAFDIAWQGVASATSLTQAVLLAAKLGAARV